MMNHINSCHSKNEMNMPGFVRCELINLYKHVRTCLEILKSLMQVDINFKHDIINLDLGFEYQTLI
jgi:hypothetical protein